MADDSLNVPVIVRAVGISASSIPIGLSPAYSQYILSQATDFTNVAGKANEAGQGAYDAQVKNDEQDVTLANHESRIQQLRIDVDDHEIRITANTTAIAAINVRVTNVEGQIVTLQADVSGLKTRMTTAEGNISTLQTTVTDIQGDYVSKTATANQMVQPVSGSLLVGNVTSPTTDKLQVVGSENVSVSYKVAGLQVLSARQAGWTAATGTAYKGAFDANQSWTVGILDIVLIQQIANSLTQARQRIKALEDALRTHGQIN